MNFFINQFISAITRRGRWLLLAIVPTVIYLTAAAVDPDSFTASQKIAIFKDGRTNEAVAKRMNKIVENSTDFFLNDSVITRLGEEVKAGTTLARMKWAEQPSSQLRLILNAVVEKTMSLKRVDKKIASVVYRGDNQGLGKGLVAFYSRILRERLEGRASFISSNNPFRELVVGGGDKKTAKTDGPGQLMGNVETVAHRAPWHPERLAPSLAIFVGSLIVLLVFIGLLEWSDPTISLERQAASYLDIVVFGSLPDLNEISDKLR